MVQTKTRLAKAHERCVLHGAMGFSRRRVLATSAESDEVWAIHMSSAVRIGVRQEVVLGREGERVGRMATMVEEDEPDKAHSTRRVTG